MAEFVVIETSLDDDLTPFSRYLWEQNVSHRVVKKGNQQWLLLGDQGVAEQVLQAYQHYRAGQSMPSIKRIASEPVKGSSSSGLQLAKTPVTATFLLLSVLGYLVYRFDPSYTLAGWLTFFKVGVVGTKQSLSVHSGEYWRLITPIFLHFTLLHVVFNCLWLWDLGRRVELLKGGFKLLGLILLIGLGSNLAQYWWAEAAVFGGMSGVIYGLLGYGWVWSHLRPQYSLQIPMPIIYFMLAWMVACLFGFSVLLGVGGVANAAHVGGLVMGLILGFGAARIHQYHERL